MENMNFIRSGSEGGGVDYNEFMNGCYIRAWDLTTSGPGMMKNMEPTVVSTDYALRIKFNKNITVPVKVLVISEKPAVMTIGKTGATGVSYLG